MKERETDPRPAAAVAQLGTSDIVASLSAFARSFGTDRETLRRRLLEGGVEPMADQERTGQKLYRLSDVFRAWTASGEVDPDALSPFNRRAWYQAELDRLKLQEIRRELIPRIEVEQETAAILKIVAETFDTLPDIIERDCGATPAQLARLEQVCDRAREEMYQRLAGEALEQPAGDPTNPPDSGGSAEAAAAFLLEALAAGPRPPAELVAEASARGIPERLVRRAKAKQPIVSRRASKGWVWELTRAVEAAG